MRSATLEQRERGGVAVGRGQVDVDSVAVEPDPATGLEEGLDVLEIIRVAGVGDLDLGRVDSSSAKMRICSGPVPLAGVSGP